MTSIRWYLAALLVFATISLAPAQLAGTYSINPLIPAGGSNFDTLAGAVSALLAQGVVGPVTFELYDDGGPFTESNLFVTANTGGGWAPSDAVLTLGVWPGASAANRVTFRPAFGEQPVFDATGRAMGVFWNGAKYTTIEGIEIMNAIYDGVCIYSESTHGQVLDAEILGCRIHDCGKVGVLVYGNSLNPQNTLIANNFFWNLQGSNNAGSFGGTRSGYIATRRHLATRVVHNTFYITTAASATSAAITTDPSCSATATCADLFAEVSNNIFVKTGAPTRPILRYKDIVTTPGVPPIQDSNCFFDTSGGPLAERVSTGNVATLDLTLADWQLNTNADLTSIGADPFLVNPANGDLHLLPGSPCQDSATVNAGIAVDIDGDLRGALIDIGADEVAQGAGTVTSVGSGCPGTNGLVPVLSGNGLPSLGNVNFSLDIAQGRPNSQSYFFAAASAINPGIPVGSGCRLHLDFPSLVALLNVGIGPVGPFPTDAAGAASLPFPIPSTPSVAGFTVAVQAVVLDPANTIGVALTNAVVVVVN